jgi:hypothetical protein
MVGLFCKFLKSNKKLNLQSRKERQIMFKRTVLSFLVFPLLSVFCTAGFADEATKPDASAIEGTAPISRLRLFGQNGASAVLFRDRTCVKSIWSGDGEKASGGIGSAFGSFVGAVSNSSLGIAETETTRNLSQKDGMLSKAYFREYVIPADKPSSISMGFKNIGSFYVMHGVRYETGGSSCHGAITFTPRAGEDYEAGFVMGDGVCRLSMNRVLVEDGKTELIPVPVTPAPDC